jgi:hypothetical protein
MSWQEIRDPATGHLLARIDPKRSLLELRRKKTEFLVDLVPYFQENGVQAATESQDHPQASE